MQNSTVTNYALGKPIVGILVLWSDSYFEKATSAFLDLLFAVDKSAIAIFVKNNKNLSDVQAYNCITINGTNVYAEFSGWQEGIEKIFQLGLNPKQIIFANDTFCNHRPWSLFRKKIYINTFKKQILDESPSMAGWKSYGLQPFTFEDAELDFWISTFLFSFNQRALSTVKWEICPSKDWADSYSLGGSEEKHFFSSKMDPKLAYHLRNWLFSPRAKGGWHSSEELDEINSDKMKNKADAILAEKRLTAVCKRNRMRFFCFQDDPYFKFKSAFNRLKIRFFAHYRGKRRRS